MNTPYVRPATLSDVHYLATRLRQADVREIGASSGLSPLAALTLSYQHSKDVRVGVFNDVPFCIFGVADSAEFPEVVVGAVWMVSTPDLIKHRFTFHRLATYWMKRFLAHYPLLYNWVDARNTVHIRWLKRLGCQFIATDPNHGHESRPFLEFIYV